MINFKNFSICYEEWDLWLSGIGILCSVILSVLIIWQTYRNHKANQKITEIIAENERKLQEKLATEQARLQYQAFQITLFDKRLPLYEVINDMNYRLPIYINSIEDDIDSSTPYAPYYEKVYIHLKAWEEALDNCSPTVELLFTPGLASKVAGLYLCLITLDDLYILTKSNERNATDKIDETVLLKIFKKLYSEFQGYNILSDIKPYLEMPQI